MAEVLDKMPRSEGRDGERGAMVLLMAVSLVAIIGVASFAVDIGMGLVAKSELQNVSDAATFAGTRKLAEIYTKWPDCIVKNLNDCPDGPVTQILTAAQTYAQLNKAGGIPISVPQEDLMLGKYDPATGAITQTMTGVRLVRVTARRDDTANGVLPTQLSTILGINQIAVRTTTASALTPVGLLKTGKGEFPIAISKQWFVNNSCGSDEAIVLFPTSNESCASWHTFTTSPASAATLKPIVNGIANGTWQSPETIAGQTYYNFIGGNVESRCNDLQDLFNKKKGTGNKMTTNIPVYDAGCGNANQSLKIIGFVRTEISQVKCAPHPSLSVTVECGVAGNDVVQGGGSHDFGFLAGSPSLIQ